MLFFTHEFGHAILVLLKGGGISKIVVPPGYEVYPEFGKKEFLHLLQTGHFTTYWPDKYEPSNFEYGFIKFYGAGFTLSISFVSVVFLWVFKPKGIKKNIIMIFSFFVLDIFTYSLFPMIGLPSRLFIGGHFAEPVEGLMKMGLSKAFAFCSIMICVILIVILIFLFIKKYPSSKESILDN
ncbi:MAG: hypothetical protein CVV24_05260 [Ignavibacteriae bacterium HGW-Ignavibacteriae-3]|nr:MAG: hypothetical protein CVV24_05260 [Ignavibacteriae bacterium HGW-Ignavibacteriae-3]